MTGLGLQALPGSGGALEEPLEEAVRRPGLGPAATAGGDERGVTARPRRTAVAAAHRPHRFRRGAVGRLLARKRRPVLGAVPQIRRARRIGGGSGGRRRMGAMTAPVELVSSRSARSCG